MLRLLTVLVPITALVLVTGCATKKPPVLSADDTGARADTVSGRWRHDAAAGDDD